MFSVSADNLFLHLMVMFGGTLVHVATFSSLYVYNTLSVLRWLSCGLSVYLGLGMFYRNKVLHLIIFTLSVSVCSECSEAGCGLLVMKSSGFESGAAGSWNWMVMMWSCCFRDQKMLSIKNMRTRSEDRDLAD